MQGVQILSSARPTCAEDPRNPRHGFVMPDGYKPFSSKGQRSTITWAAPHSINYTVRDGKKVERSAEVPVRIHLLHCCGRQPPESGGGFPRSRAGANGVLELAHRHERYSRLRWLDAERSSEVDIQTSRRKSGRRRFRHADPFRSNPKNDRR